MANPKDTIGERDYGRRTYASNKSYGQQRKLATNAHIDRLRHDPHSEFKKPYIPDQTYPEMEGFNFDPYDPKWPGLPPGEPPTTGPVDPGGPVLPVDPNKPKPRDPHLGCIFWSSLGNLTPGEHRILDIIVTGEDALASVTVEGQARITWGGPSSHVIVLWVNENISTAPIPLLPGMSSNDPLWVQVTATTASGAKCYTGGFIVPCTGDEPPPVWDWVNSGQVANPTAVVYIEDGSGVPPFRWSISGAGFSLLHAKTDGRSNIATRGEGVCGSGVITVTDLCGKACIGSVRSTAGNWVEDYPGICHAECQGQPQNDGQCGTYGGKKVCQTYAGIGNLNVVCNEYPECGPPNYPNPCWPNDGTGRGGAGWCSDCAPFMVPPPYYKTYLCLQWSCGNDVGSWACCEGVQQCSDGSWLKRYCHYTSSFNTYQWLCQ